MDPSSFYGSRRHRPDDDSSSNCSSSSNDWNPTASEEDSSTSSESNSPVHVESTTEDNETEMNNPELHADNSLTPIVASQRSFRFTGKEQLLKKPTPSGGLMNSKGVKVCNWKDKRNVLTLSTVPEHSGNLQHSGKKDRNRTEILKPQSVLDYNTAKCGVDKSDQMTSYNTALRRSTKWYRKLTLELLTGTAVVNAWVLYNQFYSQQKTMGETEFKECLVMSLITGKMNEEMLPGPKRSDIGGLRSSHSLVEAQGPNLKTRKRCRSCYEIIANNEGSSEARRKARRVTTFCDSCDGKPSLCVSCFSLRHSPPV